MDKNEVLRDRIVEILHRVKNGFSGNSVTEQELVIFADKILALIPTPETLTVCPNCKYRYFIPSKHTEPEKEGEWCECERPLQYHICPNINCNYCHCCNKPIKPLPPKKGLPEKLDKEKFYINGQDDVLNSKGLLKIVDTINAILEYLGEKDE